MSSSTPPRSRDNPPISADCKDEPMPVAPARPHSAYGDETSAGKGRTSRGRYVREAVLSGALGGGMIGAGFGPVAAASGMLVGGAAGFLVEKVLEKQSRSHPS